MTRHGARATLVRPAAPDIAHLLKATDDYVREVIHPFNATVNHRRRPKPRRCLPLPCPRTGR